MIEMNSEWPGIRTVTLNLKQHKNTWERNLMWLWRRRSLVFPFKPVSGPALLHAALELLLVHPGDVPLGHIHSIRSGGGPVEESD